MVFGIFGDQDKRKYKKLQNLSQKTITMTQNFLTGEGLSTEDRELIEEHLKDRMEDVKKIEKFAKDEVDEIYRLLDPLRHYELRCGVMEKELSTFGKSGVQFARYLRQIKDR